MSLFLFHVLNLRRGVPPAELLLAVWLLMVYCAWLVLGARIFSLHDRSRANKIRVYRHLWDRLEKLYRELGDGAASKAALRALFREAYTFFLRNAAVIEAGDRIVFGQYPHTLQCLRFAHGREESLMKAASSQTLAWTLALRNASERSNATAWRSVATGTPYLVVWLIGNGHLVGPPRHPE